MGTTQEIQPTRDQLVEHRRRLRIDANELRGELRGLVSIEGLRAMYGDKVKDLPRDPAPLREHLAAPEALNTKIHNKFTAAKAAPAARAAAALRRRAEEIEAADKRLLAARMGNDRAIADRLQAALSGDLSAYAKACEASDEAREAFERAQTARSWLED
ncbi:MAG: hypothetical protein KJ011_03240 [Burkholderiaceae bacterium]|nr:hypothetical protein [Burkholderiaceae bacterium]